MARRPKLPYRSFHEVRLPTRLRRQIKRRSSRYAHQVYGPQIQAARAQKKSVRRQYRRDVASNVGAIQSTTQALQQVPLKGLHGQYRQQVAAELAASQRDVTASLPALNAEARQTRAEGMNQINQDIASARVDQAQLAARTAYGLMKEARTDAASRLQRQHQNTVQRRQDQKDRSKGVTTATRIAANLFITTPDDFKPWGKATRGGFKDSDGNKQPPISQEVWWRRFEEEVARQSDVTHDQARKAVDLLRRRIHSAIMHPQSRKATRYGVPPYSGMFAAP